MTTNPALFLMTKFLITSVVAGLAGASAMVIAIHLITRQTELKAAPLQVLGSVFTRSLDSALLVGSILHLVSGVAFAALYILIFAFFDVTSPIALIFFGSSLGAAQGFVISFFIITLVAEHHPIEQFRAKGVLVAVEFLLGHLAYGAVVGATVAAFGFQVTLD